MSQKCQVHTHMPTAVSAENSLPKFHPIHSATFLADDMDIKKEDHMSLNNGDMEQW